MVNFGSALRAIFICILLVCYFATAPSAELTAEDGEGLTPVEQFELIVEELKPLDAFGAVEPTGDALFDKYAFAVEEYLEFILNTPGERKDYPAALPDRILAGWEAEFGDDPRYWELRFLCAWVISDEGYKRNQEVSPTSFLYAAWNRGCADSNTLLLLYMELTRMGEQDRGKITQEEPSEPLSEELLPTQKNPASQVLAAAKKLYPDEAWVYYFQAFDECNNGYYESAIMSLEDGNLATQANIPTPYPIQLCGEAAAKKETLGSVMVTGAVLSLELAYDCNRIGYQTKAAAKKFMKDYPGVFDHNATRQWCLFIDRFYKFRKWNLIEVLICLSIEKKLFDRLEKDQLEWYNTNAKDILIENDTKWENFKRRKKEFDAVWETYEIFQSSIDKYSLYGGQVAVYEVFFLDLMFAEEVELIVAQRQQLCLGY